jgi:hypothetical protein
VADAADALFLKREADLLGAPLAFLAGPRPDATGWSLTMTYDAGSIFVQSHSYVLSQLGTIHRDG